MLILLIVLMTLSMLNSVTYYEVEEAFGSFKVGDNVSLEEYDALTDDEKAKCFSAKVTLTFDPNIIFLDMTASAYLHRMDNSQKLVKIDNFDYVSSFSFKMEATSNVKIIFYKKNRKNNFLYPIGNDESIVTVDVVTAK